MNVRVSSSVGLPSVTRRVDARAFGPALLLGGYTPSTPTGVQPSPPQKTRGQAP